MGNILDNGAILPFGLLGHGDEAFLAGFNKTYKNTALRMGIITDSYDISDPRNSSQLTTEYEVMTFEQNEDKGTTTITYKNCMSAEGMGSIADYFEKTLRKQQVNTNSNGTFNTVNQDGAVVLLLCLDGVSEKAIILGAITHPNRKTNLVNTQPFLEGEYNGINVKIENDGSTTLTFKGATDNYGKPTDPTQGNTTLEIDTDGSFGISHKTVTQRFDKTNGTASLTAKSDISNTSQQGDFDVSAPSGNMNVNVGNSINLNAVQLVGTISGSASLTCATGSISATGAFSVQGATIQAQAQGLIQLNAPVMIFNGICNLGGSGGQNVLILSTTMIGTGNLGQIVVSKAVSGFANKAYAQ